MNHCSQGRSLSLTLSDIERTYYISDLFHYAINILSGVMGNSLILFPDAL